MWKQPAITIGAVVALCFTTTASAAEPGYRWEHKSREHLSLLRGEKSIWTFRFAADAGFPYFDPLATSEGVSLAEMAPADHKWHRALWFSWKFLDGVNYWDWAGKTSGVPDGRTQPVGEEEVRLTEKKAVVTIGLNYTFDDKVVIVEQRELAVTVPRSDGSYTMDWRQTFSAPSKDVVFERTVPAKKPWGGYGGLSYRAAKSIQAQRVLDSEGRQGKAGHGKPARWVDFSGAIDKDGNEAGVAIFDHPSNPRHPTPWYISTGHMAYVNPAFLFHEPYTLLQGKSFTLRYRVLVHSGRRDAASLDKEFESFEGTSN